MTPVPTPYDITAIPLFPFVPGVIWWLIVLAAAFILATSIAKIPIRRRSKATRAFDDALHEISALPTCKLAPRERLASASLIARRLITAVSDLNLRSKTATEIRILAQSAKPEIAQLLSHTATIEDLRFRPTLRDVEVTEAEATLRESLKRAHTSLSKEQEGR